MKRTSRLVVVAALVGMASGLLAQEQPPPGKNKKEADSAAEGVIARVAKDMQAAQDRLKKSDPGDVTRKIQRNIIDGLDELIKQNSMSQGGGGKSSKAMTRGAQKQNGEFQPGADVVQGSQPGQKGGKDSDDNDDLGKAKGGRPDGSLAKDKAKGKGDDKGKGEGEGEDPKAGEAKNAGKDDDKQGDKGQAKTKDPGNDPSSFGGLASAKPARAKSNLTSELYRNDWGHLPLTKRLEMDAYSKERFMPRYDEALQQYYRSIAEQSQKKDNQP